MLARPAAVDDADAKFFHDSRLRLRHVSFAFQRDASTFADAHRRRARRGVMTTPHGDVETPAFMPVGTQGAVKGVTHRDLEVARRRDPAQQHLSPLSASRRRSDRAARRPAPLHRLDASRSSPTAAAIRCSASPARRTIDEEGAQFQSHLDGSRASADAREGRRHPGAARIRHRDGARRVPRASGRRRDAARASMERTLRWARARARSLARAARRRGARRRSSPIRARRSSASCRAACFPELREESARRTVEIGFEGYAIGGLSVGEPTDVMYDMVVAHDAVPAGRSAALPDGRRHAGGPRRVGGARHRPVRLRAADAQRPERPAVHQRGPHQHQERAVRRGRSARSIRPAAATPAGPIRAPICGIFSWPARSTRPPLTRCITCTFTLTPCGRIRDAIVFGRFESFRLAFHQSLSRQSHDS